MISVVMATYNGERYVREQLVSICNQSRKPDEIMICDDHSSDATVEIIQAISLETNIPIRCVVNTERIGYAGNFRKALSLAKGDIIFFSDQDDIWEEQKIELCERFFEKYTDALALSTSYCLIDENGSMRKENAFYRIFSFRKIKKIKWKTFIRHPKYPGMAMAIRKELADKVILMEAAKMIPHDWLLNEEAAYENGMYFYDKSLTRYRIHNNNTVGIAVNGINRQSTDKREKLIDDMEKSLQTIKMQHEDKRKYLNKAIAFQRTRKQLYREGKTIRLFLYDLFHLNYISVRSLMGDLYMSIKRRI